MAILNNSAISANLVRENVQGGAIDLVYREADMVAFLKANGAWGSATGANPLQWNSNTSGGSGAAVYSESEALPASQRQTYTRMSLSKWRAWVRADVSGDVRDQVRNGGVYADPIADALAKGMSDLTYVVDQQICGATQDRGFQSAIDGGDTYAGVAPGSVTSHKSLETALGGALTIAHLEAQYRDVALSPYKGRTTHILARHNQIKNYIDLNGPANGTAANILMRFAPPAMGGGAFDSGMMAGGFLEGVVNFMGAPWVPIREITSTVIMGIDMNAGQGLGTGRGIQVLEHRPPTVEQLGKRSDDDEYIITWHLFTLVPQRNAHWKSTGVTA